MEIIRFYSVWNIFHQKDNWRFYSSFSLFDWWNFFNGKYRNKSIISNMEVIKSASFDQTFSVYMVQTFLKSLWWQFLVSCSEHPFYRVRHDYFNFFNVSILWYTNNVFLRSLSLAHFSAQFINQAFKCFWQ